MVTGRGSAVSLHVSAWGKLGMSHFMYSTACGSPISMKLAIK
jgi:hypothetical protein